MAEHRAHQPEIVQMGAAFIGVVEQVGIALLQPAALGHLVDHRLDGERHGADENRQAVGALHQRVAGAGVIQAVAGVAGFGDDRVEGRAIEGGVHLIGDLLQPPLQDGERNRIDHQACSLPS